MSSHSTRQRSDPPLGHLHVGAGTSQLRRYGTDRYGQDVPHVRTRQSGVPQGLPHAGTLAQPGSSTNSHWREPPARTRGCSGKHARTDVPIIDDCLKPIAGQERYDLLEMLEDRCNARSIMTSQLPPDKWHDQLGEATLADAIVDRVLHGTHRIALKGPSRRKEKAEV